MCLPPACLRPDLDSSQDSRKVSQGIFRKNPEIDEVTGMVTGRGGKIYAFWILTTMLHTNLVQMLIYC
jgi:hypothetical protein